MDTLQRDLAGHVEEKHAVQLDEPMFNLYCELLGCDAAVGWDGETWHRACVEFGVCDVLAVHAKLAARGGV